ncbi:YhgE/Pip domain-containing protein [Peribacillus loiseleuriae]|uniref:YhgE/Pip domain-containing protein n=1 Tax=Peribacillus loiseleuriae TaxID=1679170 RepID=UPI003D049751
MFKNKLLLLSPIIALAVIFIFSLTMIPSVNPTPENLPIAIVNEDQGVDIPNLGKLNMGKTMVENIHKASKTSSDQEPAVKWVNVNNYKDAQDGLNNQEYYAALVIPKNFSEKQASLKTPNPTSPEIQILVNQGMNTMGSTMASQMLSGIVDNMNNNVRTQLLEGFEKQGGTLTAKQASSLVSPITKKVTNVNETGTNSANGNSPVSLFQPLWMASIAGAAIVFTVINKLVFANRTEKFVTRFVQVLVGAVLALVAGFGLTWLADGMIGLRIPQFTDTALFLSITYFSFFLMISAVLSWLGFKGIPIFVITLFFGAPLLAMPPELMSSFYSNWIYSWLPMRFMVEGLRELLFFGKGLSWNHPIAVLVGIGVVSLVVLMGSVLKSDSKAVVES